MRFRFLFSSAAVAFCLLFLLAACSARPPLQRDDSDVQAARAVCRAIPEAQRYLCIEQQAIAALNPDVCRLLGIAVDDACLQAVYEAADDPAICDRLYLPGAVPACQAYYADPNRVPRLLTPTPLPDDVDLGWLAYVLDGDIWVKVLPDGQPQRITDDGVNASPRWSPSGRWLAFRKRDSQLWLHSLETGQAWAVDEGAPVYQFDWSPTEDRLAYSVGSGVMHLSVLTADQGGSTETTVLVPPQVADGGPGSFAWSPGGDRLVYDWTKIGEDGAMTAELRVIPVDGGDPVTVAARDLMAEGSMALGGWSPQGKRILYALGPRPIDSFMPDTAPLLSVAADGSDVAEKPWVASQSTSIKHLDELAPAVGGYFKSQDATALVASYGPSMANLRIELQGVPSTPPEQMAIQPAWSPSGKALAYSGMPAQGEPTVEEMVGALRERRIWVLNDLSGEESPRRLTDDPSYRDEWPQWSADGQHILFARLDVAGAASLWLVDARGGQPRQMVEKITFGAPADNFRPQIEWARGADWLPVEPTAIHFVDATGQVLGRLPLAEMREALEGLVETAQPGLGFSDLQVAEVPGSLAAGVPSLLVTWRNDCCSPSASTLLAWFDPASRAWKHHMLFDRTVDRLREARMTGADGRVYLAAINNSCAASPWGYCETLHLYNLVNGNWEQVSLPKDWNMWLSRATFVGEGIDTVAVRSSDWRLDDAKSQLFSQNHGSLHRWFDETWQRRGESYVLVDRQVEASPYNTMVEFFHALKTGGDTASWVASQQVLDSVQQMGLAKLELFSAGCDTRAMPDCETMGLYVSAAGDRRFFFDFLEQNGQFLIEGVLEDVGIGSPGGTP